ncbi:hypothetical protein M493_17070 [Geobacillus genomosp. 3]|uniref:Peptidase A2 domain-containing protein n=1 Tax=Geobacillus genomosp. 3 TaxID=1921421 RepID=S5ZSX6_GEOG3|nr:retropepsin-like aspartic protease [Geobacillus genomosp. 3]AGT33623.1 hypothetical protein M493_17070 [Geobacillus genomosp. 3]
MMPLYIEDGLLLTALRITHRGKTVEFSRALVDTGSTGTIVSADQAAKIGIVPEEHDVIYRISGVGGTEFVYAKTVDEVMVGSIRMKHFEVELGAMEYGVEVDAIIGLDCLLHMGAIIDLEALSLYSKKV